jgi:branched-chain amino acid aminotransferase
MQAIIEHLKINKDWIPDTKGSSLYLRPIVFSTEESLGVAPSDSYKFMIISCPVGAYYKEGFNPVKIYIEDHYVRAVRGGIGAAKTAGNYAASIKAQQVAKEKGFSQVLWLDGIEQRYIEEVGTMNVFFKINNEILTPELNGSILDGVTRDSAITLLKDFGYKVTERKISLDELLEAQESGQLEEAFGTGTAAVISPIGAMHTKAKELIIGNGAVGPVAQQLYDTLTGIQTGKVADKFVWTVKIKS